MRCLILAVAMFVAFPFFLQAEETPEEVVGEAVPTPIAMTPKLTPELTPKLTPELIEAYHAYQLAQLRWQQYRFVELPRQRQLLDGQVRLLDSELSILKSRQGNYRPFLQVGRNSLVRTVAENSRLMLLATEQEMQLLKDERINFMRYSRQNAHLYQLEVLRTAARVRQIVAEAQPDQR